MGEAGEEAQYVIRPPDNHKFRAGAVKVRELLQLQKL